MNCKDCDDIMCGGQGIDYENPYCNGWKSSTKKIRVLEYEYNDENANDHQSQVKEYSDWGSYCKSTVHGAIPLSRSIITDDFLSFVFYSKGMNKNIRHIGILIPEDSTKG